MKDGYASLQNAETEQEARDKAIEQAKQDIDGVAIDARTKQLAVRVDYVDKLN
jgi:hypothetical protein